MIYVKADYAQSARGGYPRPALWPVSTWSVPGHRQAGYLRNVRISAATDITSAAMLISQINASMLDPSKSFIFISIYDKIGVERAGSCPTLSEGTLSLAWVLAFGSFFVFLP
jgi:hypothetical protein